MPTTIERTDKLPRLISDVDTSGLKFVVLGDIIMQCEGSIDLYRCQITGNPVLNVKKRTILHRRPAGDGDMRAKLKPIPTGVGTYILNTRP